MAVDARAHCATVMDREREAGRTLMSAANQLPSAMTVAAFLDWNPQGSERWDLIDGTPRAMAPSAPRYGAIQAETARLIGNHLIEARPGCLVITEPGIQPRVRGSFNTRVPDLAVTCATLHPNARLLPEPLLVTQILSPSNRADIWVNVWTYVTIPSVREIVILYTAEMRVDLLRRDADGTWPDNPVTLRSSNAVTLESIAFTVPVAAFYRTA